MLLIYLDEQALSASEREQCYRDSTHLAHQLAAAGQYVAAARSSPPPPRPASGCEGASAW
jgi:hypothetical protein